MKLIFFSLLILNIGYFAKVYYFDQQEGAPVKKTLTTTGAGIVLLSEVSEDVKATAMNAVVANPVQASLPDVDVGCYAIGPFTDVFAGQNTLEQLNSLGIEAVLQAIDARTGESDYRVMISPASSAEEAFRKLRELQANDIDSYVMTEGIYSLGISLGVFSTIEGAEASEKELVELGYPVQIIEIERQSRSYWIVLAASEFGLLNDSGWLANQGSIGSREMICAESE